MSEKITVENFPVAKLDAAREALMDLHGKLVKAATKAGATAPAAPTFETAPPTSGGEPMDPPCFAKCTSCGTKYAGYLVKDGPVECPKAEHDECSGVLHRYEVVNLLVTADRPALAGWEFLAVVEPLEGGNLVRRVPGSDDAFDLTAYRAGSAVSCDHCNTVRRRTETFVVKSDGTDPAVPAGTVKRVGRNCLSAFLGGLSPATVLLRMTWEKTLKELGEDEDEGGGGGGWVKKYYEPVKFLTWTAAVVRKDGWVSKSAAAAYNEASGYTADKKPTVSTVTYLLNPPFSGKALAEWRKACEEYKPVDADAEKAVAALEWAKGLEGKSDYEYNLSLVAKQERLDPKNAGIMASAVGSYDRATLGAVAKAKRAAEVKATAPTGKGIEFEGEIISTSVTQSEEWGSTERMTVKVTNPDGSVWLAWGTIPSYLFSGPACYNGTAEFGVPEYYSLTRDQMVGRIVKIKATLEPGKDANFVFMKRPSGEFVSYGPVPKAPKKPKAPKAPVTEPA